MPLLFAWGYIACMTTSLNIIKKAEYSTTQKEKLPKLFNNKKSLDFWTKAFDRRFKKKSS